MVFTTQRQMQQVYTITTSKSKYSKLQNGNKYGSSTPSSVNVYPSLQSTSNSPPKKTAGFKMPPQNGIMRPSPAKATVI
jgi:hypothetical protein